jgi:hypothetical protein
MKHFAIALLFVVASSAAGAQVPYVCDIPSYSQAFRTGYGASLAVRQALGRVSDDQTDRRLARVREAIVASGRVDAQSVDAFIDHTLQDPEMARLLQAGKRAVAHSASALNRLRVAAERTGADTADSDVEFCQYGSSNLIGLAQKRQASEELGEKLRQRLASFGRERGVAYPDDVEAALLPIRWACDTAEGFAAAEENYELALRRSRLTLNELHDQFLVHLKIHASANGWHAARLAEVEQALYRNPTWAALHKQRLALLAKSEAWVRAGVEGRLPRESGVPCRWPEDAGLELHRLSELTRRQVEFAVEVLPTLE